MFVGYVVMFRGVYARAADGHRLGGELPDHVRRPGRVADLRGGRRRRARAQAWALRRPGMRKRVVADKTISLPRPDLRPLRGRRDRLRLRPAARDLRRPGAVHADVRAGGRRAGDDGDLTGSIVLVPPDLQRRLDGYARDGRFGGSSRSWPTSPRRPPPACATRSSHLRSRDPALLGAVLFWALPDRGPVGRVPRVRRRAAARGPDPGVLRRHARQPAADPGRRRRRRGRDGRRVRGLRRRLRPGRRGRAGVPRVHVLASADPRRDRLLPPAADGGGDGGTTAARDGTIQSKA